MNRTEAMRIVSACWHLYPRSGLENETTRKLWAEKLSRRCAGVSYEAAQAAVMDLAGWNGDKLIELCDEHSQRAAQKQLAAELAEKRERLMLDIPPEARQANIDRARRILADTVAAIRGGKEQGQ